MKRCLFRLEGGVLVVKKRCARCKRKFADEPLSPFITCPECRIPITVQLTGCHFWEIADADPRVTKHREIVRLCDR